MRNFFNRYKRPPPANVGLSDLVFQTLLGPAVSIMGPGGYAANGVLTSPAPIPNSTVFNASLLTGLPGQIVPSLGGGKLSPR